jgi:hypothetical protein
LAEFVVASSEVIYNYGAELRDNGWAWSQLRDLGKVTLSRTFTFRRADLLDAPTEADEDERYEDFEYQFRFAARRGGYSTSTAASSISPTGS